MEEYTNKLKNMRINELPVFVTDADTNCAELTMMINLRFASFLAALCRKRHLAYSDLVHDSKVVLRDAEIPQNVMTETIDEDTIVMDAFNRL